MLPMSLTDTAFYTRRAINWGILAVGAYILLRIFWSIFFALFLILFPPKAPPPNNAFGKLPAIKFPAVATPSAQLTFQLQTIEGDVPRASPSANVYFMPKTAPNLLAIGGAQEFAGRLQFDPTPIQESKNIYRFNDREFPLRRMRYDIVSGNFILRYAFEQDPSIFTEKNFPSPEAIQVEATNLLQQYDLIKEDFARGATNVTFLRLNGVELTPTSSLSQADSVRVDFFRAAIGDMKLFTPNPSEAPVSVIYSGAAANKKHILELAYTYWPIDLTISATYGLITSSQAWENLQAGGGYIARYPTSGNIAVVRSVTLGYYDSYDPQTYLQPIFVFEGDNGFLAYVPAVSSPWTE